MAKSSKLNTEWQFNYFFKDINDPEIEKHLKEVEKANDNFVKKWKERKDYLEDPKVLKEALDDWCEFNDKFSIDGKAGYYLALKKALDQNNPDIKAKHSKVQDFSQKQNNKTIFFELNLSKINEKKQKEFLDSPLLNDYKHYLERNFASAKHLLSESEEAILKLFEPTAYEKWVDMTSEFLSKEEATIKDEKGKKKSYPLSSLLGFLDSSKANVRKDAASEIKKIFEKHIEVGQAELNSVLAYSKVTDELRKFPRPDSGRHLGDDIETEVVDTLVQTVTENFDISQRFYKLKAKLLKEKKLSYSQRNRHYGEINKEYKYKDAFNLVSNVLGKLDPEFSKIFEDFNENGNIDVAPKKGKSGGAFCALNLRPHPIYILLNHNNKLSDVLTLAHEVGHGINDIFMQKNQNALNYGAPMCTAEVASTLMEDFVLQELMKEADDEMKLILMVMKLDEDIATILRQIACYNFEMDLHKAYREKGFLSYEEIGKIFIKNMKAYMGNAIDYEEGCQNWWVYWSHIRYFFYVYSYASGLLISKSLQASVKENPKFIEKVKTFLSAGYSKSPKNIFLEMGINISEKSFWEKGLGEINQLLTDTEKLAKKLKKI